MAQAALLADQIPRQLSFKHTVQIWLSWQRHGGGTRDGVSINALLVLIAEPRVGLRPGRVEPRSLKQRPKAFPLLTNQERRRGKTFWSTAIRKSSAELPANILIRREACLNLAPFGSDPFLGTFRATTQKSINSDPVTHIKRKRAKYLFTGPPSEGRLDH